MKPVLVAVSLALGLLITGPDRSLAQTESWGHLSGQIKVNGSVDDARTLDVTKDEAFCLRDGRELFDRTLTVGDDGGLKDVYVMMYFKRGDDKRPAVHPSYEASANAKVVLDNAQCQFEPRAIFLRTTQTLSLKNSDEVGHNCHIITFKNEQNLNVPIGQEVELKLNESDKAPGKVVCDIHPWMKAVILVRDEPYVAITDASGKFRIENIPTGEWTFQFWHERRGYLKMLTRDGEEFLGRRGEIELTIEAGDNDLGLMQIAAEELKE